MKKQTILFDMDDTLLYCNKFFDLVGEQFADQMQEWFRPYNLSIQEIKSKQTQIDLDRVLACGFAPNHFPQSFVDTYDFYSDLTGREKRQDEVQRLLELGASVYGHSIEPYPYMESTLQELQKEGHELHLYTGGDPTIQMRKVTEAKLERFFGDRIHVTRHKNVEFLNNLIVTHGFDRRNTWMIGNSLRTDVIPALEAGINAIFMPAEQEWAYNQVEVNVEPQGAFLTLAALNEIPEAIRGYLSSSSPFAIGS